jgi:hypothetical protein
MCGDRRVSTGVAGFSRASLPNRLAHPRVSLAQPRYRHRNRAALQSPPRSTRQYADQVRLRLAGQRYLTERQERELLLEALDIGLSLAEARGLLAATVAKRRAAREMTLDRDMALTIETMAGAKGWISRTTFEHAAALYRRLSGGAIGEAKAKGRVKQLMLRRGWKIRGEIIFGTPHWFRRIPVEPAGSNLPRQ